jgi:hypothetical protein
MVSRVSCEVSRGHSDFGSGFVDEKQGAGDLRGRRVESGGRRAENNVTDYDEQQHNDIEGGRVGGGSGGGVLALLRDANMAHCLQLTRLKLDSGGSARVRSRCRSRCAKESFVGNAEIRVGVPEWVAKDTNVSGSVAGRYPERFAVPTIPVRVL